jgi:hypothetical protein
MLSIGNGSSRTRFLYSKAGLRSLSGRGRRLQKRPRICCSDSASATEHSRLPRKRSRRSPSATRASKPQDAVAPVQAFCRPVFRGLTRRQIRSGLGRACAPPERLCRAQGFVTPHIVSRIAGVKTKGRRVLISFRVKLFNQRHRGRGCADFTFVDHVRKDIARRRGGRGIGGFDMRQILRRLALRP